MSLSAQDVLHFLNDECHRYAIFEHISLAATASGSVPSLARALRDLSGVPEADKSGAGGSDSAEGVGGGSLSVAPTAKTLVSAPSTYVLPASRSSPQPHASTLPQEQGTLLVCELPEDMWTSMGAVTETSAPSTRQLAFATEGAAFCASQNPSFAYAGGSAAEEGLLSVLPTTDALLPLGAVDDRDGAEEEDGEPESLNDGGESFSTSAGDSGFFPAAEGIQLPQLYSPAGQHVTEFAVSPQKLQDAGEGLTVTSNATQTGLRGTEESSSLLGFPRSQPTSGAAAASSVKKQSSTVAVVLWRAADVAASRMVDVTEMGQARGVSYTLASAPLVTPPSHRDPQCSTSTAMTFPRAAASGKTAAGTTGSNAEPPGFLCFAVRDIVEAESNDTDLLTPRDRRVQMLTLQIEAGAVAYVAKSLSDAFSCVSSTSLAYTFTSPLAPGGVAAARSSNRPAPGSSFAFVFNKGGIARCVAALRQHAPELVYACRGGRNNMSLLLPDGASGSSASPCRGTTTLFELTAPQGAARIGSAPRGFPSSPAASSTSSAGISQAQLSDGEMQRWRKRLFTGALFRGRARGFGGVLTHYTPNQRCEAMGAGAPNSPSPSTTPTLRASPLKPTVGGRDGLHGGRGTRGDTVTRAGRSAAEQRETGRGHSSASSFEDLTDEMTAIRLGPCYAPPRPSLSQGGGSSVPSPVTAAEWESVFDVQSEQQGPFQQLEGEPESPATRGMTLVAVPSPAKRLNASRWRAFRRAVYERGGLADSNIRFEVWCYLLGAYAVGSTEAEQAEVLREEESLYTRLTSQWKSFLPEQETRFSAYRYAKHSIMKDVQRTERNHPSFRDDDSDMLRVLRELLLAHVMLDMDLGYSQGMSDVAAVALLVTLSSLPQAPDPAPASEAAMFMCYRKILSEHMSTNFIIEERRADAPYAAVKGVQRKLYQVQVLTRHFYPSLYNHLKNNCMDENMSFAFRWILVCFKRDLPNMADTMRLWDVFFACPYTTSYEVVVTVALLGALATQIVRHVQAYETLLQFANELSSGVTLNQILVCARTFYESVCVVETREMRRRLLHQAADAAVATRGVDDGATAGQAAAVPPRRNGDSYGTAASPVTSAPTGNADVGDGDDGYPTVEEMTQLFLKTDGPL
ncbi:hypothetical protein LSCM1_02897 [Leishmania martiniquensis]|uniref:Rab-GAP TBC domain-containing protein n=1 Tax=Leishmania martiniquensis TaxID=1580590 RepID=A0A836HLY3_9TRYP|nr:hypothetical protein LSCM1_02897 [Leishmania martiniquensis]